MKALYLLSMVATAALAAACGPDTTQTAPTAPTATPAAADAPKPQPASAAAPLDDATLTAKVKTALLAAPDVSGLKIDVSTANNVVTLAGTVQSAEAREEAARVARGVEGVKEVRNDLAIANAGVDRTADAAAPGRGAAASERSGAGTERREPPRPTRQSRG